MFWLAAIVVLLLFGLVGAASANEAPQAYTVKNYDGTWTYVEEINNLSGAKVDTSSGGNFEVMGNNDFSWTHSWTVPPGTTVTTVTSAVLKIKAWDVNTSNSGPETTHKVYADNIEIGHLEGVAGGWSITELSVPVGLVTDGALTVKLDFDSTNEGYKCSVKRCQLVINYTTSDSSRPAVNAPQTTYSGGTYTYTEKVDLANLQSPGIGFGYWGGREMNFQWTHSFPGGTTNRNIQSATITIEAVDVDAPDGEKDTVTADGITLGDLTGVGNNDTSTTVLTIPSANFSILDDGSIVCRMNIDENNKGWEVRPLYSLLTVTYTLTGGGGGGGGGAIIPVTEAATAIPAEYGDAEEKDGIITYTIDAGKADALLKGTETTVEFAAPASSTGIRAKIRIPVDLLNAFYEAGKTVIVSFGGESLTIVPNSVAIADRLNQGIMIEFTMGAADPNAYPAPGDARYMAGGKPYDIAMHFIKGETNLGPASTIYLPLTLTIPYDTTRVSGTNADYLGMYRWNDSGWDYVGGTADLALGIISAQLNSLSTYMAIDYFASYSDMVGHWAENAAKRMAARHVVQGITSNTFGPNIKVTRGEFAAWLVGVLELPAATNPKPFSDVPANAWYAKAIDTAAANGLISGFGNGTFKPGALITREQIAAIVNKALKLKGKGASLDNTQVTKALAAFKDSKTIGAWARPHVAAVAFQGIVKGRGGKFAPRDNTTRAEAVVLVDNIYKFLNQK